MRSDLVDHVMMFWIKQWRRVSPHYASRVIALMKRERKTSGSSVACICSGRTTAKEGLQVTRKGKSQSGGKERVVTTKNHKSFIFLLHFHVISSYCSGSQIAPTPHIFLLTAYPFRRGGTETDSSQVMSSLVTRLCTT